METIHKFKTGSRFYQAEKIIYLGKFRSTEGVIVTPICLFSMLLTIYYNLELFMYF